MPFCYFWKFDFGNFKMTLVKQLYGRETSNLQVKFYYRAAFNNDIIDSTATLYHVQ